jgi:hypothetical protein
MAEFLEDCAGVFRGISACLRDGPCDCENNEIAVGCDLAKHQDYTVCIAVCLNCGRCIAIDRYNKLDWHVQKRRIAAFAAEYGAGLLIDSTGVGDPIYDDLRHAGVPVRGYKFTGPTKTRLIQGLIVSIEQERITWPEEWDVVTNELRRYEYEFTSQGNLRYNAPAGFHDDCVIALALANMCLTNRVPSVYSHAQDEPPQYVKDVQELDTEIAALEKELDL